MMKAMKAVVHEALRSVRKELAVLRDRSSEGAAGLSKTTDQVREALSLYARECDRRLREREQELTVDHELEMADVKKMIENREEEICTLKRSVIEKESELAEHERLISTMRQKLESEQTEMRDLQTRLHQQLEEALEQARAEKESAVKNANDERFLEIASLTNSVTQCQKTAAFKYRKWTLSIEHFSFPIISLFSPFVSSSSFFKKIFLSLLSADRLNSSYFETRC